VRLAAGTIGLVLVLCAGVAAPSSAEELPPAAPRPTPTPGIEERCRVLLADTASAPEERLHKLFDATWEFLMAESPPDATDNNYPGQNGRWRDWSSAAIERRNREMEAPARALAAIDRAALSEPERLNYDLFKTGLDFLLEGRRFKAEYLLVNQLGGVQLDVEQYLAMMPAGTAAEYEDIVARLRSAPRFVDQTTELLREGMKRGITTPRVVLRDVPAQIDAQIADDPLKSPLLASFTRFPSAVGEDDRKRLTTAATRAYEDGVAPAFRRFKKFLVETYIPKARETVGLSALPDGAAWYAYNVRYATTTRLTPREIHEIGLAEVKRIREAMDSVIAEAGGPPGFEAFVAATKKDPRFYYTDRDELLRGFRDIAKRADPELVKLFSRLPRQPYGVTPVPASSEKSAPAGYYMQGAPGAGRPALFYANTYDLPSRPKWEMEALTLHESVPGHHLQIALSHELEGVPEFRKFGFPDFRRLGYLTAFVEGWGLYAEGLGDDMGFYKDPYSKFGELSFELWRAVRLVIDTGMHALGWSRQQAIDYFKANSSRAEHDIVVEVDRYIVWPGQALGYKIGQLKIRELRTLAEKELGPRFDVRAFHDEVLGQGALPLDILDARLKEWIAKGKAE
jgi:uncharacterized protein (DUF885 family)